MRDRALLLKILGLIQAMCKMTPEPGPQLKSDKRQVLLLVSEAAVTFKLEFEP